MFVTGCRTEKWMFEKTEYTMGRFAKMYGMEYMGMASGSRRQKNLQSSFRKQFSGRKPFKECDLMNKKSIICFLLLASAVFILCACGNNNQTGSGEKEKSSQAEQIFYPIYSEEEMKAESSKRDTGLFFFRENREGIRNHECGRRFYVCGSHA